MDGKEEAVRIRGSVERRGARRFQLSVPVVFRWLNEQSHQCEGAGFSRNIGTGGVFVVSRSAVPDSGSKVEVEVFLPALDSKLHGVELSAQGTVVRVERLAEGVGLGIASRFAMFEDVNASGFFTASAE